MEMKTVFKCIVCQKIGSVRCSRCKLVHYCGRECQAAHFPLHKNSCKHIPHLLRSIREEELDLRSNSAHFEQSVGRFGVFEETELYMQARCEYLYFLENNIRSDAALLEAIEHGKGILRLWRHDGHGIRVDLTLMYLRLNTYEAMQHCYDHIKWFDTFQDEDKPHYDWNDMSLPYMDIVNADMCEEVYPLPTEGCPVNMVALLLIKLRLVFHLGAFTVAVRQLVNATVHASSPLAVVRGNQGVLLSVISFLHPNFPCFAGRSLTHLLEEVLCQVRWIIAAVEEHRNKHIWRLLAYPEEVRKATIPNTKQPQGSAGEAMQVADAFLQDVFVDRPDTRFVRLLLQAFVRGEYKK